MWPNNGDKDDDDDDNKTKKKKKKRKVQFMLLYKSAKSEDIMHNFRLSVIIHGQQMV